MKIFRFSLIIGIILTMVLALPVHAVVPELLAYVWGGGDGDSNDIYGSEYSAEIFLSNEASTATMISLWLKRTGSPGDVKVSLRATLAGEPIYDDLTYAILDADTFSSSYNIYNFDISDYNILPNTYYAIVVQLIGGEAATDYISWWQDSGGDGSADSFGLHSANGGITWVDDSPTDYLFEVWGTSIFQVVSANVFESYAVTGDWLITVNTINDYPGYSGTTNPEQYFSVQLLDVAGANVLAATTLKSYGDSVCAIYLSPTSVSALTSGSAYIIRMIGSFAGTPSVSYTLQHTASNEDWQGSDLRHLDQWCITTAKLINTYDGNTTNQYTTKSSTTGKEILTTEVNSVFAGGIPNLMDIRPDLFETSTAKPIYDKGTATNAYDNLYGANGWQIQVGSTIAADANAWGSVLGISAKQFLSLAIWLAYLFAMLFIFVNKSGAETVFAVIICIPILFIGWQFRIIESQIILIAAAVMVLGFVIKMWFTK
jgi:hypothetical protein